MTYHAGMGPRVAAELGMGNTLAAQGPYVSCDGALCPAIALGYTKRGGPARWLREGSAPPKWRTDRVESDDGVQRGDYCPRCRQRYAEQMRARVRTQ